MQEWRRSPGVGRYAQPELERRFLVVDPPELRSPPWSIEDRYIDGTSLRLRQLTAEGETVWKLAQKIRPDPADPAIVSITNMYLSREEYALLATLPAATLSKTRYIVPVDGVRVAVDVFGGANTGLILAEVEVDDLSASLPRLTWLGEEVTHEDKYSGGHLARRADGL